MHRSGPKPLVSCGLAAILMFLWSSTGAFAADWTKREFASFRFLPTTTAVEGSGELLVGLEVELAEGWQFYTENPGEYGVAPVFRWSGAWNLARVTLHWPKPRKFLYSSDPPVSTLGYKGSLLLPIVLELEDSSERLVLRLDLEYAVCDEFCIIDEVSLSLTLPAGRGRSTRDLARVQAALKEARTVAR